MFIDDLPTPCLLIERRRLEANLARMQATAEAQGVALRPHVKTHKSVRLARWQRERGARGLTVATVDEAEVFVAAGFEDVCLAYPVVGAERHARLQRLADRARISFCVDTVAGAEAASAAWAGAGRRADVFVEIDVGHGRTGVPWHHADAEVLARRVAALPGLRLAGILTHEGQAYHGPAHDGEDEVGALRRVAREAVGRMLDVAVRWRAAGVPGAEPGAFTLSIGSTPSMAGFENAGRDGFRITEIRPGNYVFNDATQVGLGSARWADCALTVLATVISKRRDPTGRERFFLDAGKKVLTADGGYGTDGYGRLLYNARTMTPLPHARLTALSEEHGWGVVPGGAPFDVGDRVRIVPNHACVTVHTQDEVYLVDGDTVIEALPVDARGRRRISGRGGE
ncbi:MAG: D-TA family PLP-dependent enzyme [Bacteroidetes bacterium]|nr:MAG: D-TA family PLP-dependent enzyme [Bacteroidota bacterium]